MKVAKRKNIHFTRFGKKAECPEGFRTITRGYYKRITSYDDYVKDLKQKHPIPIHYTKVSWIVLIVRKIKHRIKNGSCGFVGENCLYCGRKLPPDGIR